MFQNANSSSLDLLTHHSAAFPSLWEEIAEYVNVKGRV